jgi:hypothetical protein
MRQPFLDHSCLEGEQRVFALLNHPLQRTNKCNQPDTAWHVMSSESDLF